MPPKLIVSHLKVLIKIAVVVQFPLNTCNTGAMRSCSARGALLVVNLSARVLHSSNTAHCAGTATHSVTPAPSAKPLSSTERSCRQSATCTALKTVTDATRV